MSVGILAHLLGRLPYRELAAKIASYEFSYVQLALAKALADVDASLGKLSPGLGNEIGGAFADNGVKIAVLGCYASLIELDDDAYRHNIERFKEHLRNARHFGCPIVATEVGVPADASLLPEHRRRLDRALAELVEEADKWGVTIGLEAAERHLIDSVDTLAETIERFPSSTVGVVLDPCNLLGKINYADRERIVEDAFRTLGSRIVSLHAKDLRRTGDGELEVVAAGQGEMDYSSIWRRLEACKPHSFVTLEGVAEEEATAAARFVREGRAAARREAR